MIRIITVGKIKESYFRDAVAEYEKRLRPYVKLQIIEVQDEPCPQGISDAEARQIKEKEGRRILEKTDDKDYVITLEIKGKKMSSEVFACMMQDLAVSSHPDIAFVIGGSLGLSDEVMKRSDRGVSFSDMTFPHQLMRVILLEQIYRSYKINRNEPYHK